MVSIFTFQPEQICNYISFISFSLFLRSTDWLDMASQVAEINNGRKLTINLDRARANDVPVVRAGKRVRRGGQSVSTTEPKVTRQKKNDACMKSLVYANFFVILIP